VYLPIEDSHGWQGLAVLFSPGAHGGVRERNNPKWSSWLRKVTLEGWRSEKEGRKVGRKDGKRGLADG
jgi:hypothetical protein